MNKFLNKAFLVKQSNLISDKPLEKSPTIKVEYTGARRFYRCGDKNIFDYVVSGYPSCCGIGIINTFGLNSNNFQFIKNHNLYEKLLELIKTDLDNINYNQLIFADRRDGFGYQIFSEIDGFLPLSVSFNQNSGNFVYMFSYIKTR